MRTQKLGQTIGGMMLWALMLLVLLSGARLRAASIAGVVRDTANEPAPNASVFAMNLTPDPEAKEAEQKVLTATTNFDGEFTFEDLRPGTYRVCVVKPHMQLLNPCEWGTPPEVVLVDEQAAEKIVIPAVYGKAVRVRIDDPEDALTLTAAAKTGDALLGLAVLGPDGVLHGLRAAPKDRKGQEWETVVPAETELQLVVNSRNAELVRGSPEQKSTLSKDHAKVAFTVEADATVDTVLRLEMRRAKP